MDVHLKLLAEASLDVTAAEEALDPAAFHTAVERLDATTAQLDELRESWADMSAAERAVVGPAAAHVRQRLDAARGRVPRLTALSVGTAVVDPEEELEPR